MDWVRWFSGFWWFFGFVLECGDLARGFARIRCDHCKEDRLLAFSCKGRWFCPSCHQKKVQLFRALLAESILYPVSHRHFVFGIPKMLRPYFRYDRDLLKDLCRVAHECLIEFLRTSLGLPEGIPGIVMAIHTFGEYLDFHPHLHALVADGLFARSGVFHVMPETGLKPLEELFRARVITFLVDKGLLPPERARMLRGWVHSGFNVHRGRRVLSRERKDMERLAQYIIRNPFSVEKMRATEPGPASASGSILYRSGMNKQIGRNFEVFTPCDFIAAITQHNADKSFQLVRYYGWYSNKMRGRRAKQADEEVKIEGDEEIEVALRATCYRLAHAQSAMVDERQHRPKPPAPHAALSRRVSARVSTTGSGRSRRI